MNIYNQGLRYWMISYKLLKCFWAQLVAKKIIFLWFKGILPSLSFRGDVSVGAKSI